MGIAFGCATGNIDNNVAYVNNYFLKAMLSIYILNLMGITFGCVTGNIDNNVAYAIYYFLKQCSVFIHMNRR